jgi:DNA-directed RNA polymerase subunit beta'
MRTFHAGGVSGVDITQGLPRVEEIFERRMPKNPAIIAHESGEIIGMRDEGKEKIIVLLMDDDGQKGNKSGKQIEYTVPFRRQPIVKVGDQVKKGQMMTDGSCDIDELFNYASKEVAEEYIVSEINKVYELQGASISRKHVEVIIKQMFGRVKITNPGDTHFTQSDVVEVSNFRAENMRTKAAGGTEAKGKHLVLGITDVALSTDSWLSSASFQNTTRVLITASTRGQMDELRGLKENVIIGRLIPAGTGLRGKKA